MALALFRRAANQLREPISYKPLITESKAAVNLALGAMQLITGYVLPRTKKLSVIV